MLFSSQDLQCSNCSKKVNKIEHLVFTPPEEIIKTYKILMSLGKSEEAQDLLFVAIKNTPKNCFKCWLGNILLFINNNEHELNYDEQIYYMNEAIQTISAGITREEFLEEIGVPELN